MSPIRIGALILLLGICAVGIPELTISGGAESSTEQSVGKQDVSDKASRASFPSVDFENHDARPEVVARGEKYGRSISVLASTASKDVESVSHVHWDQSLSALPVEKSSLVVLGTVKQVAAYLAARKHTVYSTIEIEIERVFKQDGQDHIGIGKTLTAEREGGIVRYPSGFQVWHRIGNQRMPLAGRKYYFFLSRDFPMIGKTRDLYLVTAYGVTDGVVTPLDEAKKFAVYEGKKDSEFRTDLLEVLDEQR